MMRVNSGSRCERCITLRRGGSRDGHIDDSIIQGGGDRMMVVMGVEEKADVGGAFKGRGGEEVLGFIGDRVAGGNKTSQGAELATDGA
jgi:hypothetical protein